MYEMQVQGRKTYADEANNTAYHHNTGKECLDVHILMPALLGRLSVNCADYMQPAPAWLEYPFCNSHLILHGLPSKLAAWNSENRWARAGHTKGPRKARIMPKIG
jgi:hypothetical protein